MTLTGDVNDAGMRLASSGARLSSAKSGSTTVGGPLAKFARTAAAC